MYNVDVLFLVYHSGSEGLGVKRVDKWRMEELREEDEVGGEEDEVGRVGGEADKEADEEGRVGGEADEEGRVGGESVEGTDTNAKKTVVGADWRNKPSDRKQ